MEPQLTENARRIFDLRYSRKDEEGNPDETPAEAIRRVAKNVASVIALYESGMTNTTDVAFAGEFPYRTARRQFDWLQLGRGKFRDDKGGLETFAQVMGQGTDLIDLQAARYEEMLTKLDFLPNSPTWTGAGTPLGQLAACFVIPVADDLVSGRDSIFASLRVAAAIQQTGGGNGFSFGNLRPNGSLVKRSMGQASGPIGFARIYDAAFKQIAQGGTRRGANMLVLPVNHPDIREFINAKVVEGELDQFNISVAITDDFMDAVEKDEEFDLVHGGKVHETINANDLYEEIIQNAWIIGDPGNLFIDRANRDNPVPTRYRLEATNPCGEQWLGPYENCCLGSISLSHFVDWTDGFDWKGFGATVSLATEFLDDVVDANQYIEVVPELEHAAQGGRRIGLGLMGLADAMIKMELRYGSPEGLDFASQVTEYARYVAMRTSIERAKDRGFFEWIRGSIYDPEMMKDYGPGGTVEWTRGDGELIEYVLWEPPTPLVDYKMDFGRPSINWSSVVDGIKEHGIRNSCQFTFAPTGTISNVAGLEGSGCEPLFALSYIRKVMQDGQDIDLHYASPLFQEVLERGVVTPEEIQAIVEKVQENGGSCQGIEEVPSWIRDFFVVTADITPEEHVWTQAVLQRFVDNSISKTINLPNSATSEDVSNAYRLAYELGCKGITVYRQGSRQLEVLSAKVESDEWAVIYPKKIPEYAGDRGLIGRVYPVETAFGKVQVTITELDGHPDRPFDVRLQIGKGGNDKNADVEAIGRMISLALRSGVAVTEIVDQLEGIGGQSFLGLGDRRVKSVADGVAKLLARRYILIRNLEVVEEISVTSKVDPAKVDQGRVCPKCHNATLVMEAGCRHCDTRLGGCGLYEGCD